MRFYIQTIILNVLGDPESKFVRGRVYRGGLEGGGRVDRILFEFYW